MTIFLPSHTIDDACGRRIKRKGEWCVSLVNMMYSIHVSNAICLYVQVYGMVQYTQDYRTCRKIFFESYFSNDPTVSTSQYSGQLLNPTSMDKPCNVCDNCRRKEGHGLPVVSKDITIEAITAAKIANAVQSKTDDRVTMIKMVNYMRGRGHKKAGLEALFQSGDVEAATKRKWTDAVCMIVVRFHH